MARKKNYGYVKERKYGYGKKRTRVVWKKIVWSGKVKMKKEKCKKRKKKKSRESNSMVEVKTNGQKEEMNISRPSKQREKETR